MTPRFPDFKPLAIEDRQEIHSLLWRYQPETSELTFSNLFIWRKHYRFHWSIHQEWLILLSMPDSHDIFALPPIGGPGRSGVSRMLLSWLKTEKGVTDARIERADQRLVSELSPVDFQIQPVREQFDYLYRTSDLISLPGGKYHAKRNHINAFLRSNSYRYLPLQTEHIAACLKLADEWCELHSCADDMGLSGEWDAVREALHHMPELSLEGGIIMMDNNVTAFTLGERLNEQTAVIHIEKADMEIRGLYNMINQQFCEHRWQDVSFINREQDLGDPGLRAAKQSYNPLRLIEKFTIR
ncbi:MAG: hypothetical protein A4E66_00138 [Syntrophus sp. PtaB.Bin001]|nr:MAG: hypothetical protein A4E66_00138 [Syntrophus sp. PtaB.Bin001]